MSSPESFFLKDGETFVATELTRGPWRPEHQHGGPPAALMGRAIERLLSREAPSQVVRVTLELLRPVPIDRLSVAAEITRSGKTVKLVQAVLRSAEKELCRATALAIRTTELELPPRAQPSPLPSPERCEPFVFPFFSNETGYQTAMEVRIARGEFGKGALAAWMRMRFPLLPGEEPTPLQRALIAADSGNGVSLALDVKRYTFVNPDLTVYLHREAVGEWIGLDATTTPRPSGVGLAESALHDARGPIGRSLQSLVVDVRNDR